MEFLNILDTVKLPFEIPLLIHPITVHFAISLPIIVLILELANLFFKRRAIDYMNIFFLVMITLVFTAAFFAGKADGSHVFAMLSPEGQEELKLHKQIGMYLVYASAILLLFKLLAIAVKRREITGIFTVLLLAFIGVTLKQGKDGGELVYEFGANVEAVSKLDDKIMELEDSIDELKEKLKECEQKSAASAQNLPAPSATTESGAETTETNSTITDTQTQIPGATEPADSNSSGSVGSDGNSTKNLESL